MDEKNTWKIFGSNQGLKFWNQYHHWPIINCHDIGNVQCTVTAILEIWEISTISDRYYTISAYRVPQIPIQYMQYILISANI